MSASKRRPDPQEQVERGGPLRGTTTPESAGRAHSGPRFCLRPLRLQNRHLFGAVFERGTRRAVTWVCSDVARMG